MPKKKTTRKTSSSSIPKPKTTSTTSSIPFLPPNQHRMPAGGKKRFNKAAGRWEVNIPKVTDGWVYSGQSARKTTTTKTTIPRKKRK